MVASVVNLRLHYQVLCSVINARTYTSVSLQMLV